MNLLQAIITCHILKDGKLRVIEYPGGAEYDFEKDFYTQKYIKARNRIAGHHILNRLLKRFV